MTKPEKTKELFTASEVARFCQVDLKTIHNWADRGEIRHFRTPGRHLRFRRADVLDFLRKYGYPIPDELRQGKPRVVVVDDDAASLGEAKRTLAKSFEVQAFDNPISALLTIGAEAPDAVVVDRRVGGLDGVQLIQRLGHTDTTRHVRAVVYAADDQEGQQAMQSGASAHVAKGDAERLRETLESLLALNR